MGLAAHLGAANRDSAVDNDTERFSARNELAEQAVFSHSLGWSWLQRAMAGPESRPGLIGSKLPVAKL
jgi:hypothetical protein